LARPKKDGLDYFPFDVDFFDDEILIGISGEFGLKGELTLVKLLCAVYKKGYFVVWNDLMQAKIAKQTQSSKELVNQIVARLVAWGYFDESLFNSAKVLTSVEIQETYSEATKRRKSQKPSLYWINDDINTHSSVVNADINPQSKVKESKVNKNIHTAHASQSKSLKFYLSLPETENAKKNEFKFRKTLEDLEIDVQEYGDDLFLEALKKGKTKTQPVPYAESIAQSWFDQEIKTVNDLKKSRQSVQSSGYQQNNYSRKSVHQEVIPEWYRKQHPDKV
jgi:hypothetical protein